MVWKDLYVGVPTVIGSGVSVEKVVEINLNSAQKSYV
jgi:malate/lactate dehydrogenase